MTTKQLHSALKYWQKILRLQDWNITMKFVDEPRCGYFGKGRNNSTYQSSSIEILKPEHIDPEWSGCRDLEVTLVHELLHIRFLYASKGEQNASKGEQSDSEEFAIESTARAMVSLKRGIPLEELN